MFNLFLRENIFPSHMFFDFKFIKTNQMKVNDNLDISKNSEGKYFPSSKTCIIQISKYLLFCI